MYPWRFIETSEAHPRGHGCPDDPGTVDRVLVTYWSGAGPTDAVTDAYGRWCLAPAVEEAPRIAAYLAALAQEQTPAAVQRRVGQ